MDGKISEIIDNVIDAEEYLNNDNKKNINSINSWTKLTYLDSNIFSKMKPSSSNKEEIKEKPNLENSKINTISINEPKKGNIILNENLFKGKGYRTNIDFFLKSNSENLSLSGITDISSLSEHPNIFSCAQPRKGTNRYKMANKSKNYTFYNTFYDQNNKNKNQNKLNSSVNYITKKSLPKIKTQTEEKKVVKNKK